ncbi:unnamed protein product [Prunus armeniaca]
MGVPKVAFRRSSEGKSQGPSKLRKGAFRREGVTSSCLPKGRCDVIPCREVSFQASKGSLSKERCDVIMPSEGKV